MKIQKETFKVYVDKDGEYFKTQDKETTLAEVELAIERPSHEITVDGNATYGKAVKDFITKGVMLSVEIDDIMKARNLWGKDKEDKFNELSQKINKNVMKFKKGGCKFSDAVKAAKSVIKDRNELLLLSLQRNELNKHTAEAMAEDIRFNYLISQCTVYNKNGEKFFKSYEDYLETKDQSVVEMAGEALFKLTTGLGEDFRKDFPEYQFLLKYKLCDEKLRLIDKNGGFVDIDGKKVNEFGQWVNEKNQLIDRNGNVVDDKVEFVEFLEG